MNGGQYFFMQGRLCGEAGYPLRRYRLEDKGWPPFAVEEYHRGYHAGVMQSIPRIKYTNERLYNQTKRG